ncbi:phosphoribosylamine--glycine ligase [Clostridium tepidiprofundi DSM 19306]|uniref:Phosphoribosylamine--glycine ligase n=1 Tax=Clostridium tepidiprofundi DSM 19306 TaxID=1121338 RepID=A0A151B2Z5_9CLOT|nr:phosphoribosylamine--glycine ligase [Clostridium tepidiprofundi]KYH34309.1 phosphoribosylamine--glycine ligase [Clostridium tepidiprofundi DSM 19306]
MKVLLIGSGGREHAIAWKLSKSNKVKKIFCAPGNGGTYKNDKCENVDLNGIDSFLKFALENNIDITIVGPEAPLVEGIVDKFKENGLKIFGPSKKAALLEGSKAFAKNFMKKYGVKTAEYEVFEEKEKAISYLEKCNYPVVIKADGLAAGKGVSICETYSEAEKVVYNYMISDVFKGAGKKIVIEEYLDGVEASILSITDGNTIIPFISCMDHKPIYEGNEGPNTGGMGTIAPNPHCNDEVLKEFEEVILKPTLKGIMEENLDYIGIIFFGLMICKKGVYLLEYNVRMGDPETQAVLPLMKNDLCELIFSALDKKLKTYEIDWEDKYSCCVIAASGGYPEKYETGFEITNIDSIKNLLFIAGANYKQEKLVTTGGRVLAITSVKNTLHEAIKSTYEDIKRVNFKNMYYRKDIGDN